MGWANCGTDSKGRPIGYAHEAICDYPGCDERIDRGLAYACGSMHGDADGACEGYFCGKHMVIGNKLIDSDQTVQLCLACYESHDKLGNIDHEA